MRKSLIKQSKGKTSNTPFIYSNIHKDLDSGCRIVEFKEEDENYQKHLARYSFATRYCYNKTVADTSCGIGYGIDHIAKKSKPTKAVGLDISIKALKYGKKHFKNPPINFVCSDVTRLPFRRHQFDVVISFETIEHIPKYEEFLKEILRILEDDGKFVVSTPNKKFSSPFLGKPRDIFHAQEWNFSNFKGLLRRYFKNISFFYQIEVKMGTLEVHKCFLRNLGIRPDIIGWKMVAFLTILLGKKSDSTLYRLVKKIYRRLRYGYKGKRNIKEKIIELEQKYKVKPLLSEKCEPLVFIAVCRK